ncbi:MAG: thioesterase family protein [Putridiphycobacter sp.]|nr:thioesterase family protein [Putridiphycobacter sp.]
MVFKTNIQIRFSDCDMLNHVNNAVYLQYFETARVEFFNKELRGWDWNTNGIILAKNIVDYLKPVYLNDTCYIALTCTKIGNASFTLAYQLMVVESGIETVKAQGESVLVCFDFKTKQTELIPKNLLRVLEKYKAKV